MQRIVLNRQTHTIKVVNRKDRISLKRSVNNVTLRHTGKRGPQGIQGVKGDKGDTGVSTMVRLQHGSDASAARPDALYVEWMGSVAPLNGTTMDTWIVTP